MLDKLSKKILNHMKTASSHPSDTYYDFDDDLDAIAKPFHLIANLFVLLSDF